METNNSGIGLTLRELVLEIRSDVKALDEKIDRIDRVGSIGTREELQDHEVRMRSVESTLTKIRYGFPPSLLMAIAGLATAILSITNS